MNFKDVTLWDKPLKDAISARAYRFLKLYEET